jgi:hypothetical protein
MASMRRGEEVNQPLPLESGNDEEATTKADEEEDVDDPLWWVCLNQRHTSLMRTQMRTMTRRRMKTMMRRTRTRSPTHRD